jgi:hypothetical protein
MRERIPFKLPFLCLNFSPANKIKKKGLWDNNYSYRNISKRCVNLLRGGSAMAYYKELE